jgi:hypothetical protein
VYLFFIVADEGTVPPGWHVHSAECARCAYAFRVPRSAIGAFIVSGKVEEGLAGAGTGCGSVDWLFDVPAMTASAPTPASVALAGALSAYAGGPCGADVILPKLDVPLSGLNQTLAVSGNTLSKPDRCLSGADRTLSVPDKALGALDKGLSALDETLSVPDKTPSASDKTLSAPDKTLSKPDKTLSRPLKMALRAEIAAFSTETFPFGAPAPFTSSKPNQTNRPPWHLRMPPGTARTPRAIHCAGGHLA